MPKKATGPRPKRNQLTTRQKKAAKAIGQGASFRDAAKKAGLKSRRALEKGVTIAEWMRDPRFRALKDKYAEEAMSGAEWEALDAQVARMERPREIRTDGNGRVIKAIYGSDKAMERLGKARGKLKQQLEHTGINGEPIQAKVTFVLPDNGRRETA